MARRGVQGGQVITGSNHRLYVVHPRVALLLALGPEYVALMPPQDHEAEKCPAAAIVGQHVVRRCDDREAASEMQVPSAARL